MEITGAGGIAAIQLQAQYAAKTAKLQLDNISLQGDLALDLIASATGVGQNLDVRA